jgi:hypothetical protein
MLLCGNDCRVLFVFLSPEIHGKQPKNFTSLSVSNNLYCNNNNNSYNTNTINNNKKTTITIKVTTRTTIKIIATIAIIIQFM